MDDGIIKVNKIDLSNINQEEFRDEFTKLMGQLVTCLDQFQNTINGFLKLLDGVTVLKNSPIKLSSFITQAVYEHGPGKDHAPLLVHVIPQRKGVVPLDIVRAGRLATSVRKKFIIATVKEGGEIVYYSFIWHKP